MIVTITDTGRVTTEMAVVLTFIKKKNNIAMTNNEPSIKDICKFPIELLIKSLCRNMSVFILTSLGREDLSSLSCSSIELVNGIVPIPGCLVTVNRTAGCVFNEALPKFGYFPAALISATSARRTIPDESAFYYRLTKFFDRRGHDIGFYNIFIAVLINYTSRRIIIKRF